MFESPLIARVIVCVFTCTCLFSCAGGAEEEESVSKKSKSLDDGFAVLPIVDEDIMPHFKLKKGEEPPSTIKQYVDVVDRALSIGAYKDALKLAQQGVESHPKSGKLHYLLGKTMLSSVGCDEAEAVRNLEKASSLGYRKARLYELIATAYAQKKVYDKALDSLNKAIELSPSDRVLYKYRAAIYLELGDLKSAEADYGKLIDVSQANKSASAYISRGQFFEGQKRYKEALEDYTKAYQSGEKTLTVLKKRVNILMKLGEREKAVQDLNRIISINEKDDEAIRMRADLYKEQKKFHEALTDYTRAIKMSPDFAIAAYEGRAQVYDTMGKPQLALNDRQKAKSLYEKPAEKTLFKMK